MCFFFLASCVSLNVFKEELWAGQADPREIRPYDMFQGLSLLYLFFTQKREKNKKQESCPKLPAHMLSGF